MGIGGRRGLFAAWALAAVAALALACGGGGGDSGGGDGDTGDSSGAAAGSGDLRLLGGDPLSLDPAIAGDASSAAYIVEIFGGLVTIDRDLNIVPDIAERWEISADGTVYTFFIRRDALFHDGRPVTAEDFQYSLERTARLGQSISTTADFYLGDIVGARDMVRGRADSITGIEVIDRSTLQITIDGPKPFFIAKLTYPTAFVVDQQQVEANPRNWTRKPNGTGPYKLQEWRLNERIILEANDRYHLGAPAVKRVLYFLAGGSSLTQYENDEIDVSGIGIDDIERVQSTRDPLNQQYVTGEELAISYIGFNLKQAPFDDPKVRLAFAKSIDREQIVRVILKGVATEANSIMQPRLPGYNKDAVVPSFDPEAARQLLADSKYKNAAGLGTITLSQIGAGASVNFDTQAILEMWREHLGVDISISQSEAASFFDDLDRGTLQLFTAGWIMDYPDPEDIIDLRFYSKSRMNDTGYNNARVDELVLAARTEADVTKRLLLYQEAEQIILDEAPWVPLYFSRDHFVVKPYVKGFDATPMVIPRLRYVTIER